MVGIGLSSMTTFPGPLKTTAFIVSLPMIPTFNYLGEKETIDYAVFFEKAQQE